MESVDEITQWFGNRFRGDPGVRAIALMSVLANILLSALLIPLAFTDLRASISRTISTSDASERAGAAAEATAFRAECHPRVQELAAAHAAEMHEESILRPEMAKNIACHCGRQVAPGAGAPCPWNCAVTFCSHLVSPRTPASPGWSWPLQQLGVLVHPVCATTLAHRDLSSSGALLSEALPLQAREAAWELWHSPSAWISYVEHVELRAAGARERSFEMSPEFSRA